MPKSLACGRSQEFSALVQCKPKLTLNIPGFLEGRRPVCELSCCRTSPVGGPFTGRPYSFSLIPSLKDDVIVRKSGTALCAHTASYARNQFSETPMGRVSFIGRTILGKKSLLTSSDVPGPMKSIMALATSSDLPEDLSPREPYLTLTVQLLMGWKQGRKKRMSRKENKAGTKPRHDLHPEFSCLGSSTVYCVTKFSLNQALQTGFPTPSFPF
ncbi:hypothetical protein GGR50DRAFT_413257 [Xylaria sp. CBS 124048]|nr:hypothetical protein GGR50DRAFT_413257 [Xylaria sp. CBS 124048]